MHERHAATQQRRVHRARRCVSAVLVEDGLPRADPLASRCLRVQDWQVNKRGVQGVDEGPPRLDRSAVGPQLKVARVTTTELRAHLGEQLDVRWRDDVDKEGAVPFGAHLAGTHKVVAVPDVATVGRELKEAVDVDGEAARARQRQQAIRPAVYGQVAAERRVLVGSEHVATRRQARGNPAPRYRLESKLRDLLAHAHLTRLAAAHALRDEPLTAVGGVGRAALGCDGHLEAHAVLHLAHPSQIMHR